MLNAITLLWGVLAFVGTLLGFSPRLSILNFINIPFAFAGAVVGIIAVVSSKHGASKAGLTGLAMCVLASLFGMIRLALGPGSLDQGL